MNLSDITTKPWILALFKRDDGERFLLGDGYYDFKDSLQHFKPNSIANDIVELQGADGQLLAGQVRRSASQAFDGYIGDGTTPKQTVEQRRKDFLMFFRKKHFYTVIYIFCDGSAIQRERGYLVDAPSVPEIRQKSPEYHVALNFEDVNYYEYAENAEGEEIFSNTQSVAISTLKTGGLVWDEFGAVSEALQWANYKALTGDYITISDGLDSAPLSLTELDGNAEQTRYDGKNLLYIPEGKRTASAVTWIITDASIAGNGTANAVWSEIVAKRAFNIPLVARSYTISIPQTLADTLRLVLYESGGTAHNINLAAGSTSYTFTTTYESTHYSLTYRANSTSVSISMPNKIQLEKWGDVTSYEPFVNEIPSPNPSYVKRVKTVSNQNTVKISGKNLFNMNRTRGVPLSSTYNMLNPRTFSTSEYVVGLSTNNYFATNEITSYTVTDNSCTVLAAHSGYGVGFAVDCQESTQYTLSMDRVGDTPDYGVSFYDAKGNLINWLPGTSSSLTFTTPAGCPTLVVVFRPGGGQEATYSNVQLELGDQATSFEPFKEDKAELNLGGIPDEYQEVEYIESNNSGADQMINLNYIPTQITRFEIDYERKSNMGASPVFGFRDTTAGTQKFAVWARNATSGEALNYGDYDSSYVADTPSDVRHITSNRGGVMFYNGEIVATGPYAIRTTGTYPMYMFGISDNGTLDARTNSMKLYSFKLYEGEELSADYVPCYRISDNVIGLFDVIKQRFYTAANPSYLGKGADASTRSTNPIELVKISTYQDRIYKDEDDGKWYLEKKIGKVTYDGTEGGWQLPNTSNVRYPFGHNIPRLTSVTTTTLLCDTFYVKDSSEGTGTDADAYTTRYGGGSQVNWLFVPKAVISGTTTAEILASWDTWLTTHPTTVYYVLATPTTTEITDATLLEQLEHIYNLYEGVNHISITPTAGAQGTMKISHASELNPGGGFVWEDGGNGGTTTITIDGVDSALPTWTINGPATNPTLTNITTGKTITWTGTVPAGQTLTIDMNNQTAIMEGANVYAFITGSWIELAPGANRISYSVLGTDQPSTLSWNNIVG